jgi:hypothetical protein
MRGGGADSIEGVSRSGHLVTPVNKRKRLLVDGYIEQMKGWVPLDLSEVARGLD